MYYLKRKIDLSEFDKCKAVVIIFRFYDSRGKLDNVAIHRYTKRADRYYVRIKNIADNLTIKSLPISDVDNMIDEINEWIIHDYYCNEKGSVVMYAMAEEKE